MPGDLKLKFAPLSTPARGVLIVFCEEGLKLGAATRKALAPTDDLLTRAAEAERFKGKNGATLDIVAPAGLTVSRLVVVGVGKPRDLKANDFIKLNFVNKDLRYEDFNLGGSFSAEAAVSPSAFGLDRTTGFVRVGLAEGARVGDDGFVLPSISAETRLDSGPQNAIARSASATW